VGLVICPKSPPTGIFSPLKQNKPYVVRTQLWQIPQYPLFVGYGSIGISNQEGIIDRGSDTGDLIVLDAEDPEWERIRIFYFPAMVKGLEEVMGFLMKKGQLCPAPKLVENG